MRPAALVRTAPARYSARFLSRLLSEPDPHDQEGIEADVAPSPFWRDEEAPPPRSAGPTRTLCER